MAGMLDTESDTTMLEVGHANTSPSWATNDLNGRILTSSFQNSHEPVMISMSQDEYTNRTSRESVLQRLSEALLRRSLAKIDLSQRGLEASDARLVRMALSQNANLTVLKLGYNNLGDHGVATLASGVAVHKSLVLLDLGFNNFGDDGARKLSIAMRQSAKSFNGGTLRTLYLAGNLIGEEGALAMADFIRQGSCLRKLYMTGNRIGPGGVQAITEAILEDEMRQKAEPQPEDDVSESPEDQVMKISSPKTTFEGMQELFFGGTGMNTTGCHAVSKLLERTSCLRVISLPNCDMDDDEICLLASSIKSNKAILPLESIQLSFNNMTYKGLEALTNAVWGSTTLKELKVDNNEIGDRGAHHLAAILPTLKSLEILDIGFNSIKTTGLNVLMKAVADTDQIKSLSISGNAVDVPAAKAVAYALAYNISLRSVHLVHCSINHDGQRHISAGAVSNSRTSLRTLTGFDIGPVVVTLGFPEALKHWTNEQVMNFIHVMYEKREGDESQPDVEIDLDPLNFLTNSISGKSSHANRPTPLGASVVVDVAKKAYENLVANGVDVFSRRKEFTEPSFGSPLANGAIMIEATDQLGSLDARRTSQVEEERIRRRQTGSFVAPMESTSKKTEIPDPARKQRIVEWLCSNIQHLNELAQLPFSSQELWRLHQHYFTPVVNECGGSLPQDKSSRVVSSVPDVSKAYPVGSMVTPLTQLSEYQLTIPVSDPALVGSAIAPASLPILKRKVSYRFIGDAMGTSHMRGESKIESNLNNGSVARIIEDGHTGHSMPPKTKKARRNRTRISFVPKIKTKLDSYLDVCHEKALVTMRQLYFVEQAILGGQVNPLDPSFSPRTHLGGILASEAEMIVVDMI